MQVRWTELAAKDLEDIFEFIRQDSESRAQEVIRILFDSALSLDSMPNRGRKGRLPGTRELIIPASRHIIVYRVTDSAVQILRIYHAARDWPPQNRQTKP